MFCPVQTPINLKINEKQSLFKRSSKSSVEEEQTNKVNKVGSTQDRVTSSTPPYCLKPDVFKALHPDSWISINMPCSLYS